MERADEEARVTEPTPPTPGEQFPPVPPLGSPLPTGPAYPGPPPPGYGPPPPLPSPVVSPDDATVAPTRSRLTAGLLGIFLGWLGVHRFYLGYPSMGVLQILVTIATCGLGGLWGIVEGILILKGSGIRTDADGRPLRP
jgi:hypothetical protein